MPGCAPIAIARSSLSEAFLAADCTSPMDLGSGPLPPGRILVKFGGDAGVTIGDPVWSRPIASTTAPLHLVTDFSSKPFVAGWTAVNVDFGTAVQVTGPSLFVTRLIK
jgi:hypothetical protein